MRSLVAAVLATACVLAAVGSDGADAASAGITVFAKNSDTGVIDLDGNGAPDWQEYGSENDGLDVGEQRDDGMNLKYTIPFELVNEMRYALAWDATVTLHFRVWSTSELGSRQLVVEALDGDLQGRQDFTRAGVEVGRLDAGTLAGGQVAVDVSSQLEKMRREVVTFRLRLDPPGALDGVRSFVNVATMESGNASNRPQLHVVGSDGGSPTAPPTNPPTTKPPVTSPPVTIPPVVQPPLTSPPVTSPPVTSPPVNRPPTGNPSGWDLTFSDEFNGSSLDTSKWNYDASTFGDGNKELACMLPGNVDVGGGTLQLVARRGNVDCPRETREGEFGNGRPWTSGSINTGGKFSQATGRFEMRAKLPRGSGFWPAFWMTSEFYPYGNNGESGELDVFEVFGQNPTDIITSAHWSYDGGGCANGARYLCTLVNKHTTVVDMSAGFHTYVLEWENRSIRWYFDGVKIFEIGDNGAYRWGSQAPYAKSGAPSYPEPFTASNPMKLRINLAVGGSGAGTPLASTPATGSFEVDYVRVYSR